MVIECYIKYDIYIWSYMWLYMAIPPPKKRKEVEHLEMMETSNVQIGGNTKLGIISGQMVLDVFGSLYEFIVKLSW